MIDIRRVLCPIDFSEFSRHALHRAVAVARWYGSSVTVLHVVAQGRGAVDLVLFGSNTARVIRAATCPVLIVPSLEGRGTV